MMKMLINVTVILLLCAVLFLPLNVNAELDHKTMSMDNMNMDDQPAYKRTIEKYAVPDVTLVNQNGERVKIRELLNSKKVVIVDFIFTTCTTICPVLSAGFSNFQKKVNMNANDVGLVSISIDPENDIPKKMSEYLKQYGAKPGWDFLTGNKDDIDKVLRALNAYIPNKMTHLQLVLLRSAAKDQWIRIYGLIGTSDLLTEYEKVMGQ